MICIPRRSVTRFFIPLIDVLILLFCMFLLMPMVKTAGDASQQKPADQQLSADDRNDLERLRRERNAQLDLEQMKREREAVQRQLEQMRQEKVATLQNRLSIRVLEIGEEGELYYFDAQRAGDRRVRLTSDTVRDFIARQRREAGENELYFLLLYPRPASGFAAFPLRGQREQYDRWFDGIAHGYDIPVR
jgi:hypothetical protein